MTNRSEMQHRRLELRAAIFSKIGNRVLTRRTTGLDGLAKRFIARQFAPTPADPDLDHAPGASSP